jgi:cytidylate kinase
LVAAPEVERTVDRALAGSLTEALGRSLAEHRVAERLAGELVATGAMEEALTSALEHEEAQRLLERALASPGLERLLAAVLESRLVPELTDRLLRSSEMQAVLEYIATSPEIRRALTEQSSSLADEMVGGLRSRTESLDDAAESTIRAWLRRPRPTTG